MADVQNVAFCPGCGQMKLKDIALLPRDSPMWESPCYYYAMCSSGYIIEDMERKGLSKEAINKVLKHYGY